MKRLTAAELAAFLGLTSSAVRQIIRRAKPEPIRPVGKIGKAHLYDVDEVLRHAGTHDRAFRLTPD